MDNTNSSVPPQGSVTGSVNSLPPEALALAARMYDSARRGDIPIFQQALPAGLPPNMTNEKGDTLVSCRSANLIY
jgi:hypothetical protein